MRGLDCLLCHNFWDGTLAVHAMEAGGGPAWSQNGAKCRGSLEGAGAVVPAYRAFHPNFFKMFLDLESLGHIDSSTYDHWLVT